MTRRLNAKAVFLSGNSLLLYCSTFLTFIFARDKLYWRQATKIQI